MGTVQAARLAILRGMGFASYDDYLRSPLWACIRGEVLARHGGKCVVCRNPAEQVHHTDYSEATLAGNSLGSLLPVCATCHTLGEFDGGRKCTLEEANERIRLLGRRRPKQTPRHLLCRVCRVEEGKGGGVCDSCRRDHRKVRCACRQFRALGCPMCRPCMKAFGVAYSNTPKGGIVATFPDGLIWDNTQQYGSGNAHMVHFPRR